MRMNLRFVVYRTRREAKGFYCPVEVSRPVFTPKRETFPQCGMSST